MNFLSLLIKSPHKQEALYSAGNAAKDAHNEQQTGFRRVMWHAGSPRAITQTDMPPMLSLIHGNVQDFALDLSGLHVVVPTSPGYHTAMATLALIAGAASVTAVTRPSNRYHSAEETADATRALAALAGVQGGLRISERIDHQTCSTANILFNSDPIRPITRSLIERLPEGAIVAMMCEAWMLLNGEIDIEACKEHHIPISAVNESHPAVGGADYQPALCLSLLEEAGIAAERATVALICGNPLARNLERGLLAAGAQVVVFPNPDMIFEHSWDAVVLAQRPTDRQELGIRELGHIAKVAPDALIVQYWGDIDRKAARYFGLRVWPARTPGRGQMGLPLEALGPEHTMRLIAGSLKAAQIVLVGGPLSPDGPAQRLDPSDWAVEN